MSNINRGPSYQVSIHLAKRFQRRRFFRNQPIRNKNCLWRPYLLMDRDEISILYRWHAIDASYQVSVHLAKRFQRRRFLKIGQSETRIAYDGHVCSLHLAEGFQRRRLKCEKLTDDGCQVMTKAHISFGKVVVDNYILAFLVRD
jgi:hypothetical protein